MEIETVISAISTVGFPIAAAAALFWLVWKMQQMHKDEMDKLRSALENNTLAIKELSLKLGGDEK